MTRLPTGTVTFVFTDIEGSTELLTALGDRYRALLARHHAILRDAFGRHGGREVMTEGDAFFVVFTSPQSAVQAAADAQRELYAEPWPDDRAPRVRIGVHTGEGVLGGDNYVGLDVHRASRIAGAAHGGQILVSATTRALAEQALPDGVRLRDLGRHRLKGLPAGEDIFQLIVEGVPADFPPIQSLGAHPNNLPQVLTSFVGREQQVEEIRSRLATTRLLTLTGPGGTGKTRLAIRVAEEVLADYRDGCWFVALDAVRDPDLLPSTIADALGVKLPPNEPPIAVLEAWLADRDLLLVLDNFEQLTAAAPHVSRLLAGGRRVRVLATSRVPLGLYGEQEYPVPPLATASELRSAAAAGADRLTQYEAVRLFIERALAVRPDFRVTNENAPAVAEICVRLDGLPLAIELAAARIKLLTPEQMLARLEQSLSLLASSAQDLPARQRTLRGAIDWSYDLLSAPEQRLFTRLSVFRGGFTLEAAESVVGGEDAELDVFDGLSSLVNKSLLRPEEEATETRFVMLETIREYARERLVSAGESERLVARHAAYFFALCHEAAPKLLGADEARWLDLLQREQDNLRAAFSRAPEQGMLSQALAAAGAIWRFWQLRGHFAEGRQILERLLELGDADPRARAAALTGAGGIAYWQSHYDATARHYRAARELYESLGDPAPLAEAIYNESYVYVLGGDLRGARPLLTRSIELYRAAGDDIGATDAQMFLGFTYYFELEPSAAVGPVADAVATYRAAGENWRLADSLTGLALVRAGVGQWHDSTAALRESLDLFSAMGSELGVSMVIEATATAAAWVGDSDRSARLYGKADEISARLGGRPPSQMFLSGSFRDKALRDLGDARFAELAAEGSRLATDEASELVRGFDPPAGAPPLPGAGDPAATETRTG